MNNRRNYLYSGLTLIALAVGYAILFWRTL